MQGADAYMEKFAHIPDIQRRIFAAMLAQLDDGVGRVLAKLRESGLEEDTLIVFLSDNGGPAKEFTSSNAPLRGGKGDLWEGGIRVPFIMSWKGTLPAGRAADAPVISMDAGATALDAANVAWTSSRANAPTNTNTAPDGTSLLPLLAEKSALWDKWNSEQAAPLWK